MGEVRFWTCLTDARNSLVMYTCTKFFPSTSSFEYPVILCALLFHSFTSPAPVQRWARQSRGGSINREADQSVPRRARLSRGGPVSTQTSQSVPRQACQSKGPEAGQSVPRRVDQYPDGLVSPEVGWAHQSSRPRGSVKRATMGSSVGVCPTLRYPIGRNPHISLSCCLAQGLWIIRFRVIHEPTLKPAAG